MIDNPKGDGLVLSFTIDTYATYYVSDGNGGIIEYNSNTNKYEITFTLLEGSEDVSATKEVGNHNGDNVQGFVVIRD